MQSLHDIRRRIRSISSTAQITKAMQTFDDEVKNGQYPGKEHAYHIKDDIKAFNEMFKEFDSLFPKG